MPGNIAVLPAPQSSGSDIRPTGSAAYDFQTGQAVEEIKVAVGQVAVER